MGLKNGGGISLATKSMWETPEKFFPVVVDNFFDNPEALVEYGKSLPKERADRHPGKRSKHLWQIDEELHNAILRKILCCYYDLEYLDISWKFCDLTFHEIPRFSENKNDIRNKGWIHQDDDYYIVSEGKHHYVEVAGLIYLTPDIDPDSGTSLFDLKPNQMHPTFKIDLGLEDKRINKDDSFDREEYTNIHIEYEEHFKEKLRVRNIFNRLLAYDTSEWHGANSYYNGDGKDDRLTLTFFVGGIVSKSKFPLKRIKNSEYETVIKNQMGNYENK